jgi:hypothetical protein
MEATKESVIEYLKKEYDEDTLRGSVDEAIYNYLDDDWEEEYDDEHEAYQETGRGEAESEVITEIQNHILKELGLTHEEYCETIGQDVWETITEVYDFLDH